MKRSHDHSVDDLEDNDDARYSRESSVKVAHIADSAATDEAKQHVCFLAPHEHGLMFESYDAYYEHYRWAHTQQCTACSKTFPSARLLELHIAEYHDPIVDAKRARGDKVYACFVDGCDKVCSQPIRRRWHLIAKHNFPENYDFGVITRGIGNRRSMLREPRSNKKPGAKRGSMSSMTTASQRSDDAGEDADSTLLPSVAGTMRSQIDALTKNDQVAVDGDVDVLTNSLAALKFVPRSVRFGRGSSRGGLARQ